MITEPLLRRLKIDAGDWLAPLQDACNTYEIDNDERVAYFLANCLHESAGFTRLVESLNYSAARLLAVFPKYFTPEESVAFAHDQERIGNRVYGGRMGNGPTDGYRYRGRGLIQLTGLANYRKASIEMGPDFVADPDLVAEPRHAANTAAWFWWKNGLNELADDGRAQSIILRINGGLNGLQDRLAWLDKVREGLK